MFRKVANILKRPEYAGKVFVPAGKHLIAMALPPSTLSSKASDYSRQAAAGLNIVAAVDKHTAERGQPQLSQAIAEMAKQPVAPFYLNYLPAYFYGMPCTMDYSGPYMDFYPDGLVRIQGNFRGGHRVGYWTAFRPDGSKEWEGEYSEGNKVGQWVYWEKEIYYDSELIRPFIIEY